jgi:hypothetical protein
VIIQESWLQRVRKWHRSLNKAVHVFTQNAMTRVLIILFPARMKRFTNYPTKVMRISPRDREVQCKCQRTSQPAPRNSVRVTAPSNQSNGVYVLPPWDWLGTKHPSSHWTHGDTISLVLTAYHFASFYILCKEHRTLSCSGSTLEFSSTDIRLECPGRVTGFTL